MVRDSIGSVARSEARFRAQPVGIEGAVSRRGASSDSGTVAREPDFVLSRSVLCVTIYRIRRLPQARLVRGTIRAFVAADDFNVRPRDTRTGAQSLPQEGIVEPEGLGGMIAGAGGRGARPSFGIS